MKWELYGEAARRGEGMAGEGTVGRDGGVTLGMAPVLGGGGSGKKRGWDRGGRMGWGLPDPPFSPAQGSPKSVPSPCHGHSSIGTRRLRLGARELGHTPGNPGNSGNPSPSPLHP